jgi:hypothetical protein
MSIKETHRKLHSGEPIADDELRIAIEHHYTVVNFLKEIDDRKFDLFEKSIEEDLRTMENYQKARKIKLHSSEVF